MVDNLKIVLLNYFFVVSETVDSGICSVEERGGCRVEGIMTVAREDQGCWPCLMVVLY